MEQEKSSTQIVQTIVYQLTEAGMKALVLKRNEARGGFWSVVNGTMELGETVQECRVRELLEETNIKDVLRWTEQLRSFNFSNKDKIYTVLVFAAEVSEDTLVKINEEHSEFEWLPIAQAIQRVKFQDDKEGLLVLEQMFSHAN